MSIFASPKGSPLRAALLAAGFMSVAGAASADIADYSAVPLAAAGQVYVGEIVIGAADEMKTQGWSNPVIEQRVEDVRETSEMFRAGTRPIEVPLYDALRDMGASQARAGLWSEEALEGYLDTLNADPARLQAVQEAAATVDDGLRAAEAALAASPVSQSEGAPSLVDLHQLASTTLVVEITASAASLTEAYVADRAQVLADYPEFTGLPVIDAGAAFTSEFMGPDGYLAAYGFDQLRDPEQTLAASEVWMDAPERAVAQVDDPFAGEALDVTTPRADDPEL